MDKRHGLGRGLGSLLGEQPKAREEGLRQIPLELIDANPQQPRQTFDGEALHDLERSIREIGVLVPIIIRAKGDRYELIAGERRLRASKAAGLSRIPAITREVSDQSSLELAVVENLQREDLDPIEEAMGFSDLIRDYEYTQDRLATRLGKSRPAIANALRLLELPDEIKGFVHDKRLSAGHARALLGLPASRRLPLAQKAMQEGLSVREIERLAKQEKLGVTTREKTSKSPHDRLAEYDEVEQRLRLRLGAGVRIHGQDRGRIEISFADKDDLIRVVDLLLELDRQDASL